MLDNKLNKRSSKAIKIVNVKWEKEKQEVKQFKYALKGLLELYGYKGIDKVIIHLGENSGVKGGEIIKYF